MLKHDRRDPISLDGIADPNKLFQVEDSHTILFIVSVNAVGHAAHNPKRVSKRTGR